MQKPPARPIVLMRPGVTRTPQTDHSGPAPAARQQHQADPVRIVSVRLVESGKP